MPILAAVQGTDDGQPMALKRSVAEGFRKDAIQQRAAENLQPGAVRARTG